MDCVRIVSRWCVALALALGTAALVPPAAAQPGAAPEPWQALLPTPLLLVGEVHDAPEHQRLQARLIQQLAAEGRLAAVVIEMAEQGRSTADLRADAPPALVRERLGWSGAGGTGGWSWDSYGPVVMAAVAAGVPVLGGNLPRSALGAAMTDTALDRALDPPALERLRERVRNGHCDLLPASQIAPMTRIQIARDRALAATASAALQPGRTVLLIAGNDHVRRDLGVPRHLGAGVAWRVLQALPTPAGAAAPAIAEQADAVYWSPARTEPDHCAALRERWRQAPPAR